MMEPCSSTAKHDPHHYMHESNGYWCEGKPDRPARDRGDSMNEDVLSRQGMVKANLAAIEATKAERWSMADVVRAAVSAYVASTESNIGHPRGASVAHQIPRGAERSQEMATDPDRSQLDGPSETRSD